MELPPRNPKRAPGSDSLSGLGKGQGTSGLIYLVREAVDMVDWPRKGEMFALHEDMAFPSEQLMTLEVYCYARGVYSSEEVEEVVRQDAVLRGLFPDLWPDPRTILKYRRQHREAILECLRRVFSKAFVIRFGEPGGDSVPIDHCVALALDRWFEPICGPQVETEAAERMDRAVFWDGMAAADQI